MDENEIKMKMLSQISFIARNGGRFSSMQQFHRRCLLYGFNKQLLFGGFDIAANFKIVLRRFSKDINCRLNKLWNEKFFYCCINTARICFILLDLSYMRGLLQGLATPPRRRWKFNFAADSANPLCVVACKTASATPTDLISKNTENFLRTCWVATWLWSTVCPCFGVERNVHEAKNDKRNFSLS